MEYQIEYAYACHRGKLRQNNQDNFYCDGLYLSPGDGGLPAVAAGCAGPGGAHLFAVFDGISGEKRGETASLLAAETLAGLDPARREKSLAEACLESNRRIVAFAGENRLSACGTTAAMLLFDAVGTAWGSIGDSRVCRLRGGIMEQLSEDDVYPAAGGRKPPLHQYLGIPERKMRIEPHTGTLPAVRGDVWLLCTDGLSDMVPLRDIPCLIAGRSAADAAKILLCKALYAGGKDNITFFLLYLK